MSDQQPPPGGAAGAQASAFSPEQLEAIEQSAARVLNQSLTARLSKFERQLHEKLGESVGGIVKTQLDAFAAQNPPPSGKGKKGKEIEETEVPGDAANSTAFRTLQKQIADLKLENEKIQAEKRAERDKNRNAALRTKVAELLATGGITDPAKAKHAIALLVSDEKRIAYEADDSDSLVFLDTDGNVASDAATGLRGWLKTDEAKHFLPATGARGSGAAPGGHAPANGQKPNAAAFWEGLSKDLF